MGVARRLPSGRWRALLVGHDRHDRMSCCGDACWKALRRSFVIMEKACLTF